MKKKENISHYHHGDLRAALLKAAETELIEKGIEAFSLRGVAKRAGVSHAAPAHHFKDVNGLLTALAALGFERFLNMQKSRQQQIGKDDLSQLAAAGHGYIDFAMSNPALFRLMFSSLRIDESDPALADAGSAAFHHLVEGIKRLRGTDPYVDNSAMTDVMAVWALVHGLADLMNAGRLKFMLGLEKDKREATITEIVSRLLT